MPDALLVLNAGSSSLKLALFGADLAPTLRGQVEDLAKTPHLVLRDAQGRTTVERDLPPGGHDEFLPAVLDAVRGPRLLAAGHRVVHGGDRAGPARVTDTLLAELDGLTPLAPLHQGHNLAPIRALRRLLPDLPQVACFDTAFHRTMPSVATRFALPRDLHDSGVRRYGAHGLSYEFIAGHAQAASGRVVVAHLGSGASLCALRDGRSVDTTMGMTPLDGLVMGTRCGEIDPGALLYLLQARGMDAASLQDLLYHRAGLLGVSGVSADMRELHRSADPSAAEAVALFVQRLVQLIGAMAASMDGIDALVFTAGIGEHDAGIRAAACDRLAWLGVEIDAEANRSGKACISTLASRVAVHVIPTDEERVIARHTLQELA